MYDRDFKSQDDIINASTDLGTHNAEHLASGWLAYSALLASQTAEFQSEVIKADAYFGRSQFLTIMNSEITYAMKLGGAQDALNNALDVSKADSRRLTRIGKSLSSQSGLPLQSLGWAKAKLRGNRNTYVRTLEERAKGGEQGVEGGIVCVRAHRAKGTRVRSSGNLAFGGIQVIGIMQSPVTLRENA